MSANGPPLLGPELLAVRERTPRVSENVLAHRVLLEEYRGARGAWVIYGGAVARRAAPSLVEGVRASAIRFGRWLAGPGPRPAVPARPSTRGRRSGGGAGAGRPAGGVAIEPASVE